MKRPNAKDLQAQVEAFNARYPVGQQVTVLKDAGDGIATVTRAKAEVLSGHSAVIWLEGISGCYLLDRVTPVHTGDPTFLVEEGSKVSEPLDTSVGGV